MFKRDRDNEENKDEICDEKKIKAEDARIFCAICMDVNDLLPHHNCPQCKIDAWKICELCEENLLSRKCPICQSNYKEWKFYAVPETPKIPFNFSHITDPQEKYLKTMKTQYLCEVLSRTNAAVWCPDSCKMFFSLPTDLSAPLNEMQIILTSIPMTPDRILNNNLFLFSNSVWDEIEYEMEHTEDETANYQTDSRNALKWILSRAQSPGALIMTRIPPDEWNSISLDVFDTVDSNTASSNDQNVTN